MRFRVGSLKHIRDPVFSIDIVDVKIILEKAILGVNKNLSNGDKRPIKPGREKTIFFFLPRL